MVEASKEETPWAKQCEPTPCPNSPQFFFIAHACSRTPSCHSRSPRGSGERSDAAKRALDSNCGAPGDWLTIGSSSGGFIIACLTRLQNPSRRGNCTPSRIAYHDIPATLSPARRPQHMTKQRISSKSQNSPKLVEVHLEPPLQPHPLEFGS